MKKYEKPAIEIVEANLSTDCLDDMGVSSGIGTGEAAPGRKYKDDEDDFDDEGW